jgi:hypothetical protein
MEFREPQPHTLESLLANYRIQEFIEFRKFKEEDFPLLVELSGFNQNMLNTNFHNSFQFWGNRTKYHLELFKERLQAEGKEESDPLLRATSIYLQIAEKYGEDSYLVVDSLNRVMESLKL